MTTRETILQTVRAWFKTALSLTDAQIIPADDKGPRPPLPYLTVKVTTADIAVGFDEQVRELNPATDVPTVRGRGHRSGTVSVQGYGSITSGWLEVATLRLQRDTIQRLLCDAGITVIPPGGGVSDLSALVDTEIEPRYLREFEIGYSVIDTDAEDLIEAARVEYDVTLEDQENDPDPLNITIGIDI